MESGWGAAFVTAATGALGPVLEKLRSLLDHHGNSILDGRRETSEILSFKSELEAVYLLLMRLLQEAEDPGAVASKGWMGEARELFYDIDDAVEDYLLDLQRSDTNSKTQQAAQATTAKNENPTQDLKFLNLFRELKVKLKEVKRQCSERLEAAEEAGKNKTRTVVVTDDPRARFLHRDASELVGMMNRHKAKVIQLLAGDEEDQKIKMVCIVGFAGMGKTTLADLVYQAIGQQFQCRAFACLRRSPSSGSGTIDFLNAILRQVTDHTTVPSAGPGIGVATEKDIIDYISSVLANKRY